MATDMVRGYDLWSERELLDRTAAEHLRAVKRARILDVGQLVYARSDDLVARSPTMPPWAIYPHSPALCAGLITDYAMYLVTMSSEPLVAALDGVGLAAEWVLPRGQETVDPDQVVLRAHKEAAPLSFAGLRCSDDFCSSWQTFPHGLKAPRD